MSLAGLVRGRVFVEDVQRRAVERTPRPIARAPVLCLLQFVMLDKQYTQPQWQDGY